jgi:hypothetical protein
MNTDANATRQQRLTRDEFAALFRRLKSAADPGAADRRGALNHITAAHVMAAAQEIAALGGDGNNDAAPSTTGHHGGHHGCGRPRGRVPKPARTSGGRRACRFWEFDCVHIHGPDRHPSRALPRARGFWRARGEALSDPPGATGSDARHGAAGL